jgi:hypothetical protein
MANCGYSADKKLIADAIKSGKTLDIKEKDNSIIILFKNKINALLLEDTVSNHEYNGHKYEFHSAWNKLSRLLIKLNQIRQKNMYYKSIE